MKTTYFLYLSILLIVFNSCASLYVPNAVNTPLFTGKNQAVININTGSNGWDFQAAYAATNHLGIMANTSGSPKLNKDGGYHTHKYAEGGIGFFSNIGGSAVFELYAGGGYGHIETNSNVTVNNKRNSESVKGQGVRYFIQPSIGTQSGNNEFSFSLRGVYTELVNVQYNNSTDLLNRFGTFIEPVFTYRVGSNIITFQTQIGGCIPFHLSTNNVRIRPLILNAGISIRIGK